MAKSPDAFRTISEVADWLGIQAHVLRFWESKFTQVKPVKRAGGRRYYRPGDLDLLAGIKQLLHDDGMTIKGAQKLLREKGVKHVAGIGAAILSTGDVAPDSAPVIEAVAKPVETPAPAPAVDPIPAPPAPPTNIDITNIVCRPFACLNQTAQILDIDAFGVRDHVKSPERVGLALHDRECQEEPGPIRRQFCDRRINLEIHIPVGKVVTTQQFLIEFEPIGIIGIRG